MNLFFAKLFEQYQRKGDSAIFNITSYISIIYFLVLFNVFLPISEIIDKLYFNNALSYNQFVLAIAVFGVIAAVIYGVYHVYIKCGLIFRLTEKYKNRSFNHILLNVLVVFLPVLLLLTGATITVLLKGGMMFDHEFKGLI